MSEDKELQEFYDSMEGKTLIELSSVMNEIRTELDEAKAIKTALQKKFDALRLNLIPPAMDDDGITNMSIEGIGRLGLTADIYASIPADKKDDSFRWLRDNNHGDVIKETVNSGTLKALLKGIIKGGKEQIPEELFKVTPFSRASITRR